jgi:hypothetical protein
VHLYSDGGLDISKDGQYLFTCAVLRQSRHRQVTEKGVVSLERSVSEGQLETGSGRRVTSGGSGKGGNGSTISSALLSLGGSAYSAFMRTTKADSALPIASSSAEVAVITAANTVANSGIGGGSDSGLNSDASSTVRGKGLSAGPPPLPTPSNITSLDTHTQQSRAGTNKVIRLLIDILLLLFEDASIVIFVISDMS